MATPTITWNSNVSGLWTDNINWSPNRQPNSNDVIAINRPGFLPTITLNNSNQATLIIKEFTNKEIFVYRNGNLGTDENSIITFDGDLIGGDGVDEQDFNGALEPDGFVDDPSILSPTTSNQDGGFINNGTINVIENGYLVLGEATPLDIVNLGTINVGNGSTPGRLVFGSDGWVNAGTINLNPNSELLLGGTFSSKVIEFSPTGNINRVGNNKIAIIGQINLEDGPLVLNRDTGNYVLDGGTINGDTGNIRAQVIEQTEGFKLEFGPLSLGAGSFSTIQNLLRLSGNLDLTAEDSFLILKDLRPTTSVNSVIQGDINLLGTNAQLVIQGSNNNAFLDETVNVGAFASLRVSNDFGVTAETTQLLLGPKSQVNLQANGATLGSDIAIPDEQSQGIGIVVNIGRIIASGVGDQFIKPDQFVNERPANTPAGIVRAIEGANLFIGDTNITQNGAPNGTPRTVVNRGILEINNATVTLVGNFTNVNTTGRANGFIRLEDNGTLKLQGPFNPSDITSATFSRTPNNRVEITGTLERSGNETLVLKSPSVTGAPGATGDFFINGGLVDNVIIDQRGDTLGTGRLRVTDNINNVLFGPGTILQNNLDIEANGILAIRNGASFTGTATLESDAVLLVDDNSGNPVDQQITFNNQNFRLNGSGARFGVQATDTLILGPTTTVELNGVNSSLTSDLGSVIGAAGTGTGTIINKGSITSNATSAINPDQFKNEGTVTVNGAGNVLTIGGTTTVGDVSRILSYDGSTKTLTEGIWKAINGTINLVGISPEINDAEIEISGATAGFQGLSNFSSNTNKFTLANNASFTTTRALNNSGTFVLDDSTLIVGNPGFSQTAGNLSADGTIQAQLVDIRGGVVDIGGVDDAGKLNIIGNYTQATNGVVNLELGGTAETAFDNFDITGNATFGSNTQVNVSLLDGFVPQDGDRFVIYRFDSSSTLNNIDFSLPTLPGFTAQLNSDNITLIFGDGGPQGPEILIGTPRRDTLIGTPGRDHIFISSRSRDTLTTNGGQNTFRYNALVDAGDIITDFNPNGDILDMTGVLGNTSFPGTNQAPALGNYIILGASGTDTLVKIDADGSGGPGNARDYLLLQNVTPGQLSSADFIFPTA